MFVSLRFHDCLFPILSSQTGPVAYLGFQKWAGLWEGNFVLKLCAKRAILEKNIYILYPKWPLWREEINICAQNDDIGAFLDSIYVFYMPQIIMVCTVDTVCSCIIVIIISSSITLFYAKVALKYLLECRVKVFTTNVLTGMRVLCCSGSQSDLISRSQLIL